MHRLLICVSFVLVLCARATAQQPSGQNDGTSRAAIATAARLEKSKDIHPIVPGRVERFFLRLSDDRVLDRLLNPRHGWFLRLGSPVPDFGLGGGPAWRASNPARDYTFTISAAASVTSNWIADATLDLPKLGHDRFFANAGVLRAGRTSDDFWGLGMSSDRSGRSVYKRFDTWVTGNVGIRVLPWLNAGTGLAWIEPSIRHATKRFPSIQQAYTEASAPGIAADTRFVRPSLFIDADYRESTPPTRTGRRLDQPPLTGASHGGRYQFAIEWYNDHDVERYSFRRTTMDVQQYIPFAQGHRVIALHALAILSDEIGDQIVPFYWSPTLGGVSTLRAFPTHRFRDQNMMVVQAEYRYEINGLMSGALFVDAGQVSSRIDGIALSRFKTSYGTGIRFGAGGSAAFRFDIAFGNGAPRLVVGAGHAF